MNEDEILEVEFTPTPTPTPVYDVRVVNMPDVYVTSDVNFASTLSSLVEVKDELINTNDNLASFGTNCVFLLFVLCMFEIMRFVRGLRKEAKQ